MKTPLILAALLGCTALGYAADKTEKSVALKNSDGLFVLISASGGLCFTGKDGGQKSTFTLTDVNGGSLDDGDQVQLKYTPGESPDAGKNKPSYFTEKDGEVRRYPKASETEGAFKVKSKDGKFLVRGPSGKFIKKSAAGVQLATTESEEEAAVFEVIERTTP